MSWLPIDPWDDDPYRSNTDLPSAKTFSPGHLVSWGFYLGLLAMVWRLFAAYQPVGDFTIIFGALALGAYLLALSIWESRLAVWLDGARRSSVLRWLLFATALTSAALALALLPLLLRLFAGGVASLWIKPGIFELFSLTVFLSTTGMGIVAVVALVMHGWVCGLFAWRLLLRSPGPPHGKLVSGVPAPRSLVPGIASSGDRKPVAAVPLLGGPVVKAPPETPYRERPPELRATYHGDEMTSPLFSLYYGVGDERGSARCREMGWPAFEWVLRARPDRSELMCAIRALPALASLLDEENAEIARGWLECYSQSPEKWTVSIIPRDYGDPDTVTHSVADTASLALRQWDRERRGMADESSNTANRMSDFGKNALKLRDEERVNPTSTSPKEGMAALGSIELWVQQLVGPDPVQRSRAAEQLDRFSPFVCAEAVSAPDFPTRAWLDDLIDCVLALTLRPDEDDLDAVGRALQRMVTDRIFESLSAPLRLIPERLAELLAHFRHRPRALRACTRLGVHALPLLPLVDDATALEVLRHIGPAARDAAPECVTRLVDALAKPTLRVSAIQALGAVTTNTEIAVDMLLALEDGADSTTREACVVALGEIGMRPEAIIPRLIAALDDFPAAACAALERFGPLAAPATAALTARLVRPLAPGEAGGYADRAGPAQYEHLDDGVLRALTAIGAAAAAALPELERLHGRGHPVDEAIARIRGTV